LVTIPFPYVRLFSRFPSSYSNAPYSLRMRRPDCRDAAKPASQLLLLTSRHALPHYSNK
jgi:hypothetical protein